VLDFGIAQGLLERESDGIASGTLLGTPAYMAPEQALGRTVDARADVYAVTAMLYELVAGRRVFDGDDPNHVLSRVVCGDFVPLRALSPELPEGLLAAVDAGLQQDPELRISSDELARALALFARSERPSSDGRIGISSRAPIPDRPAALSHAELVDPCFPRLRAAPFDATALDALDPGETQLTPSERVRRRATTLPAEASKLPRAKLARAELWVVLGAFAAGVLLSWASTGF
jgi:serine/threonine protein kinase